MQSSISSFFCLKPWKKEYKVIYRQTKQHWIIQQPRWFENPLLFWDTHLPVSVLDSLRKKKIRRGQICWPCCVTRVTMGGSERNSAVTAVNGRIPSSAEIVTALVFHLSSRSDIWLTRRSGLVIRAHADGKPRYSFLSEFKTVWGTMEWLKCDQNSLICLFSLPKRHEEEKRHR